MDILGIGFSELLFIFIIALMVFGPRRLPEIAGKAGKYIRDLRNMSQGFLAEWQREITVATRLEELEQVRKELEETKQSLRQTQVELTTGATQIGQTLNSAAASLKPTTLLTSPNPPAEKIAENSEPGEVIQPVDSASPATSAAEEGETISAAAETEKKEDSDSPAPQTTPATIGPSEVVE
jgi:Tat protein translocase TatB subunit